MNRRKSPKQRFACAVVFVLSLLACAYMNAQVCSWSNKGVSIQPRWNTDFSSSTFQQSVRNAAAVHANSIYLIIPLYQSNVGSTDVQTGGNTPTDQSLADAISFAHSLGLKVTFKVHLFPNDGQWSAFIDPSDRNTWFSNYGNLIRHYAGIAQTNHVEQYIIGNELLSMSEASHNSTNTQNWQNLIASVRSIYSGLLGYNANWGQSGFVDEKNNIAFWGSLDFISISAYFNLNTVQNSDGSDNLSGSWNFYLTNDISLLHNRTGKPIIFGEIGYKAENQAHDHPWMWWQNDSLNLQEQANDYQALFSFWNSVPWFNGVGFWFWSSDPNAGGTGDNDYTPQGKPAQTVMSQWFGQSGSNPPPPPAGSNFSASASFTPAPAVVGQTENFNVSVIDNNGTLNNVLVDWEVYDSSGARAIQQFFSGQNLNKGAANANQFSWAPQAPGTFTVKMGVFSNDWSTNFAWNNQVAVINVGSASNPPPNPPPAPPPSGSIDNWWPIQGSNIGGVQPFKALIDGAQIDSYTMYWQVASCSGDFSSSQLNLMPDNNNPTPHKEASINLNGWTWCNNGASSGQYTINFVAKDSSGNTIAQKSVMITVAQ